MKKVEKIGKYKILETLGQGAMGIVYRALDPDIDREVAIKTIRFDMITDESGKSDIMKRFMREAQAVGKLEHPNIVTIYDVGREKDLTYIVMQVIDGESLKEIIESGKKYSITEVVQIMQCLCDSLGYAHNQGVVHRDVKPANILIDRKDKIHLVDFGVARIEMSNMTTLGTVLGTPSYMAPEQVMGSPADNRADIFALGVILFELLAGRRPFEGDRITTVIYKIAHEEPPFLSEVKDESLKIFEPVIKKALAKDPKDRYQTCFKFMEDLQKCTLPISLEATVLLEPEEDKEKKRFFFRVILPVAIILGFVGAFLLSPKFRQIFLPKQNDIVSLIDTNITPSNIIPEDSGKREVRYFFSPSKKAPPVNYKIIKLLEDGKRFFRNEEYLKCLQKMKEVLVQDSQNREAKRYRDQAQSRLSSIKAIKDIIKLEMKAEENKELDVLFSFIGQSLKDQMRVKALNLINKYDEIKSEVAMDTIRIEFKDTKNAQVTFNKRITAKDRKTNWTVVPFNGKVIWMMKKQGKDWKIIKYDMNPF